MQPDVVDLQQFYEGHLGNMVRHMIRRRIRASWPSTRGLHVLGLGYATPYLRQFRGEAERIAAFMLAEQGVHRWPTDADSRVALVDDTELPLEDGSNSSISAELRELTPLVWEIVPAGDPVFSRYKTMEHRADLWLPVSASGAAQAIYEAATGLLTATDMSRIADRRTRLEDRKREQEAAAEDAAMQKSVVCR